MKAGTKKFGFWVVVIAGIIIICSTIGGLASKIHTHDYGKAVSNENGTHTVVCEDEECGKSVTEKCNYDKDDVCKDCGYELVEEAA